MRNSYKRKLCAVSSTERAEGLANRIYTIKMQLKYIFHRHTAYRLIHNYSRFSTLLDTTRSLEGSSDNRLNEIYRYWTTPTHGIAHAQQDKVACAKSCNKQATVHGTITVSLIPKFFNDIFSLVIQLTSPEMQNTCIQCRV